MLVVRSWAGGAPRSVTRCEYVDTPVVTASRLQGRGTAFGEMSVSLVDVLVGDFVVVEGEDQDGQTVAHRVTIVETRRKP